MQKIIPVILFLTLIGACTMLTLQPANFAWPIESVVPIDENGNVMENRYSTEFNTIAMFYEEFQDSSCYRGKEIRLIRDDKGYYYITCSKFKNVYVFNAEDGKLVLENKIFISEFGIEEPAFNQRSPFIELLDGDKKINLTNEGIQGDKE